MRKTTQSSVPLSLVFFLLLSPICWHSSSASVPQDEESLGRRAEQAGSLREALRHYVNALQQSNEGEHTNRYLREQIIGVVKKLKNAPATPAEAIDHEGRGEAALKSATKKEDFLAAAAEYREALRAAPWVAPDYFKLGFAREKAGDLQEAIQNYELYLLAATNPPDAVVVRKNIEALRSEVGKPGGAGQQRLAKLSWLLGKWQVERTVMFDPGSQPDGYPPWYVKSWGTVDFILNNNTVEGQISAEKMITCFDRTPKYADAKPLLILRGELRSDDGGTIEWTYDFKNHYESFGEQCDANARWRVVTLDVSYDKRKISFTAPGVNGSGPAGARCGEFEKYQFVLNR